MALRPFGFFRRRWYRQVPLGLLIWRDMILVATAFNLATSFASLMALGFKAPAVVASAIYLSPMPYNVFLAAAVWRTADLSDRGPAAVARSAALIWLIIAAVI